MRIFAAAPLLGASFLLLANSPVSAATGDVTISSGGCPGGGSLFCYAPAPATAITGAASVWTNASGAPHTVTLCTPAACPGFSGNTGSDQFDLSIGAANGSTAAFTFAHPGVYVYYCKIHGYAAMHGRIVVTASAPSATPRPTALGAASPTPGPGTIPTTGAGTDELAAAGLVSLGGAVTALAVVGVSRRRS
jgi:plastocyanin